MAWLLAFLVYLNYLCSSKLLHHDQFRRLKNERKTLMRGTLCWLAAGLLATGGLVPLPAQWVDAGLGEDDCTIGVAAGSATSDGRPLIWKTRDATAADNVVSFDATMQHRFIAIVTAGATSPWMAVNERGFALVNANSLDLPASGNSGNGNFMRYALGTCATVSDFQSLLDSTNVTGRLTQAHFAVIDTTGAAAIFETGGDCYWKYDATDPVQSPDGYVVRTNFALNGGGTIGIERYTRSCDIIAGLRSGDSLNYQSLIRNQVRDFSDPAGNPFPVPCPSQPYSHMPFGYVCTSVSICRAASVSAAVIQGVVSGEPAMLTTMWTMLGQPAAAITVPFWPVGEPPPQACGSPTAPLCDEAIRIKSRIFEYAFDPVRRRSLDYVNTFELLDGTGAGVWSQTLPAETGVFADAEVALEQWRTSFPAVVEMLAMEATLAARALATLRAVRFDSSGDFGPNDKLVSPAEPSLEADTLEYLIRFQNMGVDTAFNVTVRDMLDSRLDVNTVQPGAGSHPYTFAIVDPNELVFTFSNISLPDSSVNEAASHGFVKFKVRPVSGSLVGNCVDNQAAILFDSKPAVFTNTVRSCLAPGCFSWTSTHNDASVNKNERMGFKIPTEAKLMARSLATDADGNSYVAGYSERRTSAKSDYVVVKYDVGGTEVWARRYDGPSSGNDKAYGLAIDGEGNVYVTGESRGSSATGVDILTIKYSPSGDSLWAHRYSGRGNKKDVGYAVAVDTLRHLVYVAGESDQGSPTRIGFVVICLDATTGGEHWVATYEGAGNKTDKAYAIAVDPFGDVVVVGESNGGPLTKEDYAVVKYRGGAAGGARAWVQRYDGSGKKDYPFAVKVDGTGDVYVTGASEGAGSKFDFATLRIGGSTGDTVWCRRYDNSVNKNDFAYDLGLDVSGNVYVTGASEGVVPSTARSTQYDYATVKYNSAGAQQWVRRYDSGIRKKDIARSIAVCDAENAVFVTGSSDQGAGRKLDFVTQRIDMITGDGVWEGRQNGAGLKDDIAYGVVVRSVDGCVILAGTSFGGSSSKLDLMTIQGSGSSAVPLPISSPAVYDGDEVEEVEPSQLTLYDNYPNPFNPTTTLRLYLPQEGIVSLKVYNVLGQEVVTLLEQEWLDAGTHEVSFEAGNLATGVYFCRLVGQTEDGEPSAAISVRKMLLLR
jgi:uncharacterized repeat protein (TIGR01451 family)